MCLTGYCFRQQSLTGSGRAYKQIAGVTRGDNQLTFWTEDVQQALNGQLPLKS